MEANEIIKKIDNVSNNLKWREIERVCSYLNYKIKRSKKGYKVYLQNNVWSVHLGHKSTELLYGSVREFKKLLIKEGVINDK